MAFRAKEKALRVMKRESIRRIQEAKKQFSELETAYLKVIDEAEKLAETMDIEDSDLVLRKIFPVKAYEDKTSIRGEAWFINQLESFKIELIKNEGKSFDNPTLPSRRYICKMCGAKGRRNNKESERRRPPICPFCERKHL